MLQLNRVIKNLNTQVFQYYSTHLNVLSEPQKVETYRMKLKLPFENIYFGGNGFVLLVCTSAA